MAEIKPKYKAGDVILSFSGHRWQVTRVSKAFYELKPMFDGYAASNRFEHNTVDNGSRLDKDYLKRKELNNEVDEWLK